MVWMFQSAEATVCAITIAQFLTLVFGSCWLFMFMAEDITQDVVAFNFIATTATDENCAELMSQFCDLVQIYTDAKG